MYECYLMHWRLWLNAETEKNDQIVIVLEIIDTEIPQTE